MALVKANVKTAILNVLNSNMENTNPANSRDTFADALATVICDAVKAGVESAITATPSGLIAPAGTAGGPVTGAITLTVNVG
jgi:hypothetical protein